MILRNITILILLSLVACRTNYTSSHKNYDRFNKDINDCLIKSCGVKNVNSINKIFIISPAFAYGGGGEGGSNVSKKKNISYKIFNLCLKEKGYIKEENGIFELPSLSCE